MKIALCLFKYFPYGGLQRDFFRIAQACVARGHEVNVYTMSWQGSIDKNLGLHLIPSKAMQNHTRSKEFIKRLRSELNQAKPDVVVGFNKMPMLDVYYAADDCYQAKIQRSLKRWLPRHRTWLQLENAVFQRGRLTEILLIAPKEQNKFQHFYGTEPHRFHSLPPGITKDRIFANDQNKRSKMRQQLALQEHEYMVLMVGSGFKTKGLDRAIKALAALPPQLKTLTKLCIVGQDRARPFLQLAKRLQVHEQVIFLGPRDDVPELLLSADLLIHPAYHENTGTVLLEALVSGLPALTVDVCGYAHYIKEANAGIVLDSPFQQNDLNVQLSKMLQTDKQVWRHNALNYSQNVDLFSLVGKAVEIIEHVGKERANLFRREY